MHDVYPVRARIFPRFGRTALLLLAALGASAVGADQSRWAELRSTYFGEREILPADGVLEMQAPSRAHDAAIVPIVLRAVDPARRIRQIHLIVDKNPLPLAGIFRISDEVDRWETLETRIRINEYTDVRAIAELADGSLYMASSFIKASGGCSAPAMADMDAAMQRAGKMQLLFAPNAQGSAATAEAVIKISHPNNSGMQFDQISRNYIPAFYVHTIQAEIDGKPLIEVETNFSLSENPVVHLNFEPGHGIARPGNQMRVIARDSKGNNYEKSLVLE